MRIESAKVRGSNKGGLLFNLKSVLIISMVELDHQRSAANTLVDKMGLDTFVLDTFQLIEEY